MTRRELLLAGTMAFSTLAWADKEAVSADAILGDWTTEKEESIFHFYREGDLFHGRITWMREPVYPPGDPEAGQPKHDRKTPDKALRAVPLQDYRFMQGFRFKEDKWGGGTIYDPTEGNNYKCQLHIEDGSLKVRGYIGLPLLGRTVKWDRPSEALYKLAAESGYAPSGA